MQVREWISCGACFIYLHEHCGTPECPCAKSGHTKFVKGEPDAGE